MGKKVKTWMEAVFFYLYLLTEVYTEHLETSLLTINSKDKKMKQFNVLYLVKFY